jgi:hypothetical protein
LLERSTHLAALGEALRALSAESSGRIVLVTGEAGAGKSALLRAFCDRIDDSSRILWGSCDALFTPRPLGPFLDFARTTAELGRLVESGAQPHEVAFALMEELRTETPTVLVLEDLHWADEGTLDVFKLLGRRIESIGRRRGLDSPRLSVRRGARPGSHGRAGVAEPSARQAQPARSETRRGDRHAQVARARRPRAATRPAGGDACERGRAHAP